MDWVYNLRGKKVKKRKKEREEKKGRVPDIRESDLNLMMAFEQCCEEVSSTQLPKLILGGVAQSWQSSFV